MRENKSFMSPPCTYVEFFNTLCFEICKNRYSERNSNDKSDQSIFTSNVSRETFRNINITSFLFESWFLRLHHTIFEELKLPLKTITTSCLPAKIDVCYCFLWMLQAILGSSRERIQCALARLRIAPFLEKTV